MSDKPRRWFQVHLSTAVVMMFVASALVGANFVEYKFEVTTRKGEPPEQVIFVGAPFPRIVKDIKTKNIIGIAYPGAGGNMGIGGLVLGILAYDLERRIRRREK